MGRIPWARWLRSAPEGTWECCSMIAGTARGRRISRAYSAALEWRRRRQRRGRQRYAAVLDGTSAGHTCLVHLAGEAPPYHRLRDSPCLDQPLKVDAGGDAHAVQHVDQVLSREVPRGTGSIWATAQARHRGVEVAIAEVQADQSVRQRGAPGVVQVER